MTKRPKVYLIAGSNGAGKTTFANEFLPQFVGPVDFVNADLIAQGLSPFDPSKMEIRAARMVLERVSELSRQSKDFAFETTLSGRSYATIINRMKSQGYQIHMYYLWIPNYQLALQRIKERVMEGGHNVPVSVVRRRFEKTSQNLFNVYLPLLDHLIIFDNSSVKPKAIYEKNESLETIINAPLFNKIRGDHE